MILTCLTDDITWEMPGNFALSGKATFDKEIEDDACEGQTFAMFPVGIVSRAARQSD